MVSIIRSESRCLITSSIFFFVRIKHTAKAIEIEPPRTHIFASRDIEKGELVHVGYHSDVIFPSPIAWRKFVFSLPPPFACDQTDWHWMQRLEEGGPYRLIGSLNISSLMNSGGIEFGPGRMPNLLPSSSTSGDFYATKDIEKGEEILTDYDAYTTNWKLVGL